MLALLQERRPARTAPHEPRRHHATPPWPQASLLMVDSLDAGKNAAKAAASDPELPERPRLRDRLIGALLPGAVAAVCRVPKGLFAPTARLAAFLHRHTSPRDMSILRGNLEHVLHHPPDAPEHRRMVKAVTLHQSTSALETIRASFRPGDAEIVGLEKLKQLIERSEAAGKGTIIATAHLGTWELVGRAMDSVSTRTFHALAKPPKIPGLAQVLEDVRSQGQRDVFWTGRKSLLRDMLQALRAGESLGIVMDQKPEVGQGRVVTFFDRPTPFVVGPGALASRTSAAVIAVFCLRRGPFRYEVVCEELFPPDHGETDEDVLTQRMALAIETAVRSAPEQWAWTYRRWRFEENAS